MGNGDAPRLDEVEANAEIRRLRTVLGHYANRANWGRCPGLPDDESCCLYLHVGDGWEIAAAALATTRRPAPQCMPATPPASALGAPLPVAASMSTPVDQPA